MQENKNYWFKRRRYGWGWTPVTWQGWLTILLVISGILFAGFQLPPKPEQPTSSELLRFFVTVFALTAFTLAIGYLKGPKPRWRWGSKPTDDPDEDF